MKNPPSRAVVIGMGEVGRRVAAALEAVGVTVVPVTRKVGWERLATEPDALDLVCVREEALPDVLARLRGRDPRRLVLCQNGWVRPLLEGFPGAGRAVVWFTSKGTFFKVLRETIVTGPAAAILAGALARSGIAARAVDEPTFRAFEAEKMGFNCVVGLPLAVHGMALGDYLIEGVDEAEALFAESVKICAKALGVAAGRSWWGDFLNVTEPLRWVRTTSPAALEYRNGAVVRVAGELGMTAPVNERLLAALRAG